MSPSHYSMIERGKIAFPNADLRRRLAAALRTTHLELLIHAGELLPDELPGGQPEPASGAFRPGSPAARVVDLMETFSEEEIGFVLGTAEFVASHRQPPHPAATGGHRPKRQAG